MQGHIIIIPFLKAGLGDSQGKPRQDINPASKIPNHTALYLESEVCDKLIWKPVALRNFIFPVLPLVSYQSLY